MATGSTGQPGPRGEAKHVVLIGAGIVGAAIAVELMRRGQRVTIIEPETPGGEHAASYGNGGWLSPSLVVPVALPGLWRKVPGYLANPLGPLTIDWWHLPRLAPWMIRFIWAGFTERRVEATSRALRPLVANCHERHYALAAEAGVADLIEKDGQLQVYPQRVDFEKEAFIWKLRREAGASWRELDEDELRRQEPMLDGRYTFGVILDGYNCINPGVYVAALVRHAEAGGATRLKARATGFRVERGRVVAVVADAGEIACDEAVICAGVRSKALAKLAGDRVSLEAERGYHVLFTGVDPLPRNRVLLMDRKTANTPSRFGLRVTGHVEFTDVDAPPDWRRTEILRDITLGAFKFACNSGGARFWMGSRPSTSDSLPVIGRASALPNVIHAYGHGHIGVASAPNTARAVADIITNSLPEFDLAPYSPRRF